VPPAARLSAERGEGRSAVTAARMRLVAPGRVAGWVVWDESWGRLGGAQLASPTANTIKNVVGTFNTRLPHPDNAGK